MSASASAAAPGSIAIRRATPNDADACGAICYNAFATINKQHDFPPDIPAPEHGKKLMGMMFSHPGFFCVVAEQNGKIIVRLASLPSSEHAGPGRGQTHADYWKRG